MVKGTKEAIDALKNELMKEFSNDIDFVNWHLKTYNDEVVLLSNGYVYATVKPKIETNFCFGWDTDYSGHEYEDACKREAEFLSNVENFKKSNLEGIDEEIENLKNRNNGYSACKLVVNHYANTNIVEPRFLTCRTFDGERYLLDGIMPDYCEEVSDADIDIIIEALERTRAKFEKRLNTYIKKYGTSKLNIWTYWRDE